MGTLGARLVCGRVAGSVACPVGSSCLLSAGVCCPTPGLPVPPLTPTVPIAPITPTTPINPVPPIPSRTPVVPPLNPGATATPTVVAKCQFGSPLTNAAGVELFCGPGPKHVNCPTGSRCVIGPNNVFAACCALAGSASTFSTGSQSTGSQNGQSQSTGSQTGSQIGSQPQTTGFQTGSQPQTTESQTGSQPQTMGSSQTQSASQTTGFQSPQTAGSSESGGSSENASQSGSSESQSPQANMSESSNNSSNSSSTESDGEIGPVRFLNVQLLQPTEALAMWAPPNGTQPTNYTAEISYDGSSWRRLSLEEPESTFVTFMVTDQKNFQVRVTPEGGAPAMAAFNFRPQPQKKGNANTH